MIFYFFKKFYVINFVFINIIKINIKTLKNYKQNNLNLIKKDQNIKTNKMN